MLETDLLLALVAWDKDTHSPLSAVKPAGGPLSGGEKGRSGGKQPPNSPPPPLCTAAPCARWQVLCHYSSHDGPPAGAGGCPRGLGPGPELETWQHGGGSLTAPARPHAPHPSPQALRSRALLSAETLGPMAVWKPLWFLTQTKALHLPYLHHTQEKLIGDNALHATQWPGMSEMPCPAPCQLVAPEGSGGSQHSPHNFYGGSLMLSMYLNPTLNFFSA